MLIKGIRQCNADGSVEAYIPIADLRLPIVDSSEYANQIGNLIQFAMEYKFHKKIPIEVAFSDEREFGLRVEICPEFTAWIVTEQRINHRISQYALAKKMGKGSNNSLSRFENAERVPTLESLEQIADALGYDLEVSFRRKAG